MSQSWVVIKFGGTSVSSLFCWQQIKAIAQAHAAKKHRVLIVCSALSGVSDQLTELGERSLRGDHQHALQYY